MGYLIVLRGPMGSGKSSISVYLKQRLGGDNNAFILDLDRTDEEFERNLRTALTYTHVVGEMSNGISHTENPQEWIKKFIEKDTTILSVILLAKLETCIKRVKERHHDIPSDLKKIEDSFNTFYQRPPTIFATKAQVEEICMNTEQYKNEEEVADEVLIYLNCKHRCKKSYICDRRTSLRTYLTPNVATTYRYNKLLLGRFDKCIDSLYKSQ